MITAKELITELEKFPPDTQVMLWDGWEREYNSELVVKSSIARKLLDSNWTDIIPYLDSAPEAQKHITEKEIIEISAIDNTGRIERDR